MIERIDSKDGERCIIAIYPDEDVDVFNNSEGIGMIEGTKYALRGIYDCLADLFCGEDGEDEEEA